MPQIEYEYQYSEENIRIYLNIRAYTGPWAAVGGGHRPILYGGGSDRWRQLMALVGGNGEKTCNKICSTWAASPKNNVYFFPYVFNPSHRICYFCLLFIDVLLNCFGHPVESLDKINDCGEEWFFRWRDHHEAKPRYQFYLHDK